jgi:hypothetical protein
MGFSNLDPFNFNTDQLTTMVTKPADTGGNTAHPLARGRPPPVSSPPPWFSQGLFVYLLLTTLIVTTVANLIFRPKSAHTSSLRPTFPATCDLINLYNASNSNRRNLPTNEITTIFLFAMAVQPKPKTAPTRKPIRAIHDTFTSRPSSPLPQLSSPPTWDLTPSDYDSPSTTRKPTLSHRNSPYHDTLTSRPRSPLPQLSSPPTWDLTHSDYNSPSTTRKPNPIPIAAHLLTLRSQPSPIMTHHQT